MYLNLFIALIFLNVTHLGLSRKIPPRPLKAKERQQFVDLAAAAYDPDREGKVATALKQAAGVYVDTGKSKALELESTVLMVSE